ncbi:MAG: S8 family serine peptidase [Deltaproteobacteria bacterium]|nr:S8 family serine peptidase [Deltaproteobacteria bacterium]
MRVCVRWRGRVSPVLLVLLVAGTSVVAVAGPPVALRPPAPMPPRTRLLAGDAAAGPGGPGGTAGTLPAHGVLVRGGDAAALRAAGAEGLLRVGDTWAVRAPVTALGALARVPGVTRVDAGHRLRPLLDESAPAVGAPAARARFDLAGRGILVGIIDTGIDTTHADFRRADGTTRIRYLLDLSGAPTGRHPDLEEAYGAAVYDRDDIDAWLTAGETPPTNDTYGHGTHVAGIAAGSGAGTRPGSLPGRYVGIAPEADLVVVKASRDASNMFSDADVVLGVRFVFDTATQLGAPAIANLSLGGQGGPHDGSTALEQALQSLLADDPVGRAIVVAAGNDGALDMHASGSSRAGGAVTIGLDVLDYTPLEDVDEYVYLELWYPANSDVSVALVSPDGRRFGPVAAGRRLDEDSPAGRVTIDVDQRVGDGVHAGTGLRIRESDQGAPAAGHWRLEVHGTTSRWDLWVAEDTLGQNGAALLTSHLDPDFHLAIPAMAEPVIAAGSFVSRNRWVNVDAEVVQRASVPGRVSWFSATGPTADGRLKPDLAAPGDFIVSSLSVDAYPTTDSSAFFVTGDPHYLWGDDGVHGALRGTSQAAPHVAGALALLLEAEPRLSATELRETLRLTAATDDFTVPGHAFGPRYGFGKLDVSTALRRVRGDAAGPVSAIHSTVGVSHDLLPPESDRTVTVVVVPKDDLGLPLGPGREVAIEAPGARFSGAVVDAGTGRYERTLGSGARGAVATIVATADGVRLASTPRVWYVDSREEIGALLEAVAPGCAVPGARPTGGAPLLVVLAALAAGARAARRRG